MKFRGAAAPGGARPIVLCSRRGRCVDAAARASIKPVQVTLGHLDQHPSRRGWERLSRLLAQRERHGAQSTMDQSFGPQHLGQIDLEWPAESFSFLIRYQRV